MSPHARKPYAKALGIEDRPPSKPAPIFLIGPLVCGAITIVTTALLLRALGITDYGRALTLGAIVGLGYLGTMTVNIAIKRSNSCSSALIRAIGGFRQDRTFAELI